MCKRNTFQNFKKLLTLVKYYSFVMHLIEISHKYPWMNEILKMLLKSVKIQDTRISAETEEMEI